MANIPVVKDGMIELLSGESILLESEQGKAWLNTIDTDSEGKQKGLSFRYESAEYGSFTARNQPVKDVSYWYASRKVAGKVYKSYIGKLENVTIKRLQLAAKKLAEQVAEELANPKAKAVDKKTQAVGDKKPKLAEVSDDRIEKLEAQFRQLQEEMGERVKRAVEEVLRGKLAA
jgi:hypothetical protein